MAKIYSLEVDAEVPKHVARLSSPKSDYIAIISPSKNVPRRSWLVLQTVEDSGLGENVLVSGIHGLSGQNYCLCEPVTPKVLSKVILTTPKHLYPRVLEQKEDILRSLPKLVHQGTFLSSFGTKIHATEPTHQGIFDINSTAVAIVGEPSSNDMDGYELDLELLDMEISHFLDTKKEISELKVEILCSSIPIESIHPTPEPNEDLHNTVFLRVDQIARLGIFSGDLLELKTESRRRLVRVFTYPDLDTTDARLYVPPLLAYNLGNPLTVELKAFKEESAPFTMAKDVTISRVASPISSERMYHQAVLAGLRYYFENGHRIVQNGDMIGIPIDTLLSQSLYAPSSSSSDDETALTGKPDVVVWFQVAGLPKNETQYVIDPSQTRMIQSGTVQTPCVPAELKWHRYFGLKEPFHFRQDANDVFLYAQKLRKLLKSAITPRGLTLNPTMLLTSIKSGVGKSTVLNSVAAELGIHTMVIDCVSIIGDSDVKTVGTLKARLERAASISPCLVVLRHLEFIAKKSEQDGKDAPIISSFIETLDEFLSKSSFILAATTSDPEKLSESVRARFKFEIEVGVPTDVERRKIFEYLTSLPLEFDHLVANDELSLIVQGYELCKNIQVENLALQSAGLTPSDLEAIINFARHVAFQRSSKDRDLLLCQKGFIQITEEDMVDAISDARSKYSDSIGAPKIPNVLWKDVGGLEHVKYQITDTIEMPLKHPELFSSGIKTRSGILFYGPPGTGKTLLAKAIATNYSLNFFSVKGPELLNMYIGESEANVRRVFQKARDAKPCVLFFDELDSVAPKRGNQGDSGGVMDRIVSQLLAELDGMSTGSDGVFVIGATNRPDLLDEALLRPGRFDKMIYLGVSDTHERQENILQALTRKFDLADDVSFATIAGKCPFTYTGADFYAISSDAMLNAMTRRAGEVDKRIEEHNRDRVARGKDEITIRSWFENVATDQDIDVKVCLQDFEKALSDLVPSVSAEELNHYLRVRNHFEQKATTSPPKENGVAN